MDDPIAWAIDDRRCTDQLIRKGPMDNSKQSSGGFASSKPSSSRVRTYVGISTSAAAQTSTAPIAIPVSIVSKITQQVRVLRPTKPQITQILSHWVITALLSQNDP